MTIEVPVLRLGLAGYTEAQHKTAADAAAAASSPRASWELGAFADADAWWLEGSRTLLMANEHLRVQPAVPSGRSVQLALADVDRPVAFSQPITAPGFKPAVTFNLADKAGCIQVLNQFSGWLQTTLAQFALASSIADQQPSLNSGSWEVLHDRQLLAVVDLKLGAAVMPGVAAKDFADASWCIRDHGAVSIPPNYPRASVSQVMWQFAQRTQRDLLPPHYRNQPLFFRRPPRLPQRQLKDAHLLVMRELVSRPGMNFNGLQQSTGMGDEQLARVLSALYVVGSITSNPKRALASAARAPAARDSVLPEQSVYFSVMDSSPRPSNLPGAAPNDLTAPLPLMPDRG
ncbi:hypothetical protein H8N03_23945 [Ramlibacter sp. USB13]|uniref:Uncharacterized protein n=1 Tax=Ramlibacter cellulosilyticus TaxID=2764187 RepID=A0A923SHK7_9BURK|nr:hypothetical protein [Ramlibacter cellulosilyticus]MBC5786012.1 hypothetical protein [Ramlibacter cellulosilyticus]